MFIRIHDTLVNTNYIHSIHPIMEEKGKWWIIVDYITYVKTYVNKDEVYQKVIAPRRYHYETKTIADKQFYYLTYVLAPKTGS